MARSLRGLLTATAAVVALGGCGHDNGTPAAAADGGVLPPGVCIGVKPPDSAWSAAPTSGSGAGGSGSAADAGPEVGMPEPKWALRDFQPQSCGYGATYGLDVFHGQVTLAAVLEGT